MSEPEAEFRQAAIRPTECLRAGWLLVRDRYWFFLGITTVGLVVGSLAPLGLLLGPMICGIYLCLLRRMRGEPVAFKMLLGGFDYFLQSFVATLIQIVPIMAMAIPVNLFLALLFVRRVFRWVGPPYSELADLLGPGLMAAVVAAATAVIFLLSVFFGTFFMFGYPLIVDRGLSGWEAVKLSARASRANFAGAARLMAATTLLSLAGSVLCYVGAFFVTPVTLAAWAVAYRRVFPERSGGDRS